MMAAAQSTPIGAGTAAKEEAFLREQEPSRKSRLRVLHVLPYLGVGGTEHNVFKLANGLDSSVFEQALCAVRRIETDLEWLRNFVGKVFVAGEGGSGFRLDVVRLARVIKQYRPHIVHSRNWGAIEAVAAARLMRVPVVIHSEHGYEMDILQGLPLRQRLLRRMFYRMADAVFTVTEDLCRYHSREAGTDPGRIRVIANGVDTELYAPRPVEREAVRSKLGFKSDDFVIGSAGRMVPIKDLFTLLRAVEMLAHKNRRVRLLLLGSGPQLTAYQKEVAASPELTGRVLFLGACANVPELLVAMDVFALTSISEGMSNTLLEAMAAGLPMVATRVGGNLEVVEEGVCGFLFTPRDSARLAELLLLLAGDRDLREKFAAAARRRAVTRFSLPAMLRSYRELYLELAAKRGLSAGSQTFGGVG